MHEHMKNMQSIRDKMTNAKTPAERQALMDRIPQEMLPGILEMPAVLHVLTHRDLHLHPVQVGAPRLPLLSEEDGSWFERAQWQQLGLPAPVRKLLEEVA